VRERREREKREREREREKKERERERERERQTRNLFELHTVPSFLRVFAAVLLCKHKSHTQET
jgi:hypothetical protein